MNLKPLAPIVLFVFKRPNHTKSVIEALLNNKEAKDSILYIFADGAKNSASESELESIKDVRNIISKIEGFKQVIITERETNFGLKNNIINGINDVLDKFNSVIVLEDDIVPQLGFLEYMNNALFLYENEDKIYVYYSAKPSVDYYLKTKIFNPNFPIIFGNNHRENSEAYIKEFPKNYKKIWLLFTHIYKNEDKYILNELQKLGFKEIRKYKSVGACLYYIQVI